MAKTIFRPGEIVPIETTFVLDKEIGNDSDIEEAQEIIEDVAPVYTGPSSEDLRREAEEFRASWEIEKARIAAAAADDARSIVERAKMEAEALNSQASHQSSEQLRMANEESARILDEARARVSELETATNQRLEKIESDAKQQGYNEGYEKGYAQGQVEVDRLVSRVHTIYEKITDKRAEILEDAEVQVVQLVVLMARKVIKVIADNQQEVILENIKAALAKIKEKADVVVHVNLADLQLSTEHIKDFLEQMETGSKVSIIEDTSLARGGCFIETDFGEIDARITSQLKIMEEKILEAAPVKAKKILKVNK